MQSVGFIPDALLLLSVYPGFAGTSGQGFCHEASYLFWKCGFTCPKHFLAGELLSLCPDSAPEKLIWIPESTLWPLLALGHKALRAVVTSQSTSTLPWPPLKMQASHLLSLDSQHNACICYWLSICWCNEEQPWQCVTAACRSRMWNTFTDGISYWVSHWETEATCSSP